MSKTRTWRVWLISKDSPSNKDAVTVQAHDENEAKILAESGYFTPVPTIRVFGGWQATYVQEID